MTGTTTAIDRKAGYCAVCRRGSHVMCSSVRCECFDKDHPNRPDDRPAPARPAATTPPPTAKVAPASATARALSEPVFERVRQDPPEKARKPRISVADKILPILEDIERVGDKVWWRVALFPKVQEAARARTAVLKRLGEAAGEWEFKAAKVPPPGPGASELYARRVDR